MSRVVRLRVDQATYDELEEAALAENRPISDLIITAALERIRERQFTDLDESAEIAGNRGLLRRLQTGSQQARARRGRFRDVLR